MATKMQLKREQHATLREIRIEAMKAAVEILSDKNLSDELRIEAAKIIKEYSFLYI